MYRKVLMITTVSSIAFAGATETRNQIRIVGSTTVYPSATVVAEQLCKVIDFKTSVVESTSFRRLGRRQVSAALVGRRIIGKTSFIKSLYVPEFRRKFEAG